MLVILHAVGQRPGEFPFVTPFGRQIKESLFVTAPGGTKKKIFPGPLPKARGRSYLKRRTKSPAGHISRTGKWTSVLWQRLQSWREHLKRHPTSPAFRALHICGLAWLKARQLTFPSKLTNENCG